MRRVIDRLQAHRRLSPGAITLVLCVTAFLGALQVSVRVFDRVPHVEDEVAFLFQARTIASGRLLADAPAEPDFFRAPFVIVREGKWFGKYPPGYPAVLALGAAISRPWLVNPLLAATCAGLVYVAGRRWYGAWTGLLAAALLVASPFFLLQSGSLMSHLASLFWTLLFLLLFDLTHRRRLALPALGAGAALGMLFITRPLTTVGVALPFLVWCGVHILRDRRRLLVYLPIVAGFLPFAGMLLAYNQMTTGNPLQSAYVLWWPYDRIGFGEGIGVDGHHTLREGIRFARINFRWLRMYLYGWPLELSLVPAGIASAVAVARMAFRGGRWVRARRRDDARPAVPWSDRNKPSREALDLLLVGIVVGIMVVHLAYATPGFMYGPRYYFETIGALVLLSARGLFHIAASMAMLLRLMAPAVPHPRLASFGVVLVVAVALFTHGYSHFAATEFRKFTGWNNVTADNVREVKSAGLSDAVVFVQREKWTDYAPFFAEHGPRLDSDVVYAIDLGPSRNRDLMRQYPQRQFYRFANDRLARISR